MKFQFKIPVLVVLVLLFLFTGISIGSFLYAPKATNHLLSAGIAFFPALSLLLKGRVKTK
jgi:hypothetical protein